MFKDIGVVIVIIVIAFVFLRAGIFSGNLSGNPVSFSTTTSGSGNYYKSPVYQSPVYQSPVYNPNTVSNSGIQTPGKEGTISISADPYRSGSGYIYMGAKQAQFLGVKIYAQNSDMDVERITVNLGSSPKAPNMISQVFSKIYIFDDSYRVLASSDLSTSTVNRQSMGATNTYSITFTGFHMIVPANSTRSLVVAFDTYPVIDSQYRDTYTVSIDPNGIRAKDGAGINQLGPSTSILQTQTIVGGTTQTNY